MGAPQTFHEFEQAVGKIANCKWCGEGWGDYVLNESTSASVKRIMPDADWVIVNKNHLERVAPSKERRYKVGVFLSDLHGKTSHDINSPVIFRDYLNTLNYDAFFLKYLELHGCGINPHLFEETLKGGVYHLPWSVDCDKHAWCNKKIDVTFAGNVSETYPLRKEMWNNLYHVARGYKIVRALKPDGKTFDRKLAEVEHPYVGEDYCRLLNETKIMIFDCSKYRYPVQKYFEASASGCLMVCDEPSSAKKLGFIDGETYVDVNLYDWDSVLRYCLENYDSVKRIMRNGLKNTLMNHSHEKRAKEFVEMLS